MRIPMNFKTIILLLFALGSQNVFAQEILNGLQFNQKIKLEYEKRQDKSHLKSNDEDIVLSLPFFDDFSTSKIITDQKKWTDNYVFINNDFAFRSVNKGVATFDALNEKGTVYTTADHIPFKADVLTSQRIRLDSVFEPVEDKLSPKDSLYLSFFYQPQGRGDEPEPWDTLLLEMSYPTGDTIFDHFDSTAVNVAYYFDLLNTDTIFPGDTLWAPPGCNQNVYTINYLTLTDPDQFIMVVCDSVMAPEYKWKIMWESEGMKLTEFNDKYGKDFVQVMIPITDTVFFNKSFQFRFRNYASIANDVIPSWKSNVDFWNIDYVYLNYNRRLGDTTYQKLVFSERAPSFLKNYEVMPYRQYKADAPINTLRPDINMYIANLDDIGHNTNYMYTFSQVDGDYSKTYNGGSCNLPPFNSYGFQNCESGCGAAHACPPVFPFNYDYDVDTASYIIKHYISDSSETNTLVDSIIYRQGFYNYYAYDDGTPEFGYGLVPARSQLAYQFTLSVTDTLYAVQMMFNKTLNNANELGFDLIVLRDNNGKPGEEIYRLENQEVKWEEGIYKFYTYILDEPQILSGTFYVGWEQYESGSLNIGFDIHEDRSNRIFYNTGDAWYQSNYPGSLMIRPVIGSVGSELIFNTGEISQTNHISIFPNPTSGTIKLDVGALTNPAMAEIEIYNLVGSKVLSHLGAEGVIFVRDLPNGIYILKLRDGNRVYTSKLIKN